MRKFQHAQLLDLVKILHEVNNEICRLAGGDDSHAALRVLADAQAFAVQIGTHIEQIVGEGREPVTLLE